MSCVESADFLGAVLDRLCGLRPGHSSTQTDKGRVFCGCVRSPTLYHARVGIFLLEPGQSRCGLLIAVWHFASEHGVPGRILGVVEK